MDRLARLATGGKALREQFLKALALLESKKGYGELPALFATNRDDAKELAYLQDALATSIDQLIEGASPDARRLLWIIGLANDPVTLVLLQTVWSMASVEQEGLAAPTPDRLDLLPLLRYLLTVGLAAEEREGPEDDNPDLTCHELVRERIREWMAKHPEDQGDLTENFIRLAYAKRLGALFEDLSHKNVAVACEAGRRAIIYYEEAHAYDCLSRFAGAVVLHSSGDPGLLDGLLPHLQAAAKSAPNAKDRWLCVLCVADALDNLGRTHDSLPFYEEAAALAKSAADAGGNDAAQAWVDYGTITGNWAVALRHIDDLEGSRKRQIDSGEARKKGGAAAVYIIAGELEVLNIDVILGHAAQALPQIEEIVVKLEGWWQRSRSGETISEAPNQSQLALTLLHALDTVSRGHIVAEKWELALRRADAIVKLKRTLNYTFENIGVDQLTRAFCLTQLGRYSEAKAELEHCLQIFQNNADFKAKTHSYLAVLFAKLGDDAQAINQARRALAILGNSQSVSVRGGAHYNLARRLEDSNDVHARAEAPLHELAALIYLALSGQGAGQNASFLAYEAAFCHAQAAGVELAVPRLAELLAYPAFRPLRDWLEKSKVDTDKLQATVDRLLEQIRQAAVSSEQSNGPTSP
jgi:tetratricopeptide (TPR) repeat protein